MLPFQQNVSSKFGAPMGRESDDLSDFRSRLEGRARNIWNGVLELLWWGDFPYDG